MIVTDVSGVYDAALRLVLQPDGKIIVGTTVFDSVSTDLALVRFLPDGSLDESFGDGGLIATDLGGDEGGWPLALQPDGKVLLVGWSSFTSGYFLVRYLPDGTLDPSFGGGDGIATTQASGSPNTLVLQPDGKILGSGTHRELIVGSSHFDLMLVRHLPDGTLDPSFGDGGIAITDVGGSEDVGLHVALQEDGKVLLGGRSNASGTVDFLLARYLNDGGGVTVEPLPGPAAFALSSPTPHPFGESARLILTLDRPQIVHVAVYDALGRAVAVLHDAPLGAGAHVLTLDGSRLAPGVYVVRAEGEAQAVARRVVRY